jgi:hypothetical protein
VFLAGQPRRVLHYDYAGAESRDIRFFPLKISDAENIFSLKKQEQLGLYLRFYQANL